MCWIQTETQINPTNIKHSIKLTNKAPTKLQDNSDQYMFWPHLLELCHKTEKIGKDIHQQVYYISLISYSTK